QGPGTVNCPGSLFMAVNAVRKTSLSCCTPVTPRALPQRYDPQVSVLPFAYPTRRTSTMLERLSAKARECFGRAEGCAERSSTEPNPETQRDLFEMERLWLGG